MTSRAQSAPASLPAGPRAPRLLQSAWWGARPQGFLESCRRRFGTSFTVRLAQGGRWVFLADPRDAATVFTSDPSAFHAGGTHELLEPLFGARSVHLLDGSDHARQRRLLMPPLHGEHLARYAEVIAEVTREELPRWPCGEEFAVLPRVRAITLEVIMRGIFGFEARDEGRAVRAGVERILRLTLSGPRVVTGALLDPRMLRLATRQRLFAFRRAMDALDAALFAEIAARREAASTATRRDMLSLLLAAQDEGGQPLNDQELKDNLVTILIAGHETTATGLAWALHSLARCPPLPTAGGDRLEEDLLDSIVRETLRLHPPVPLAMRSLAQPLGLAGATLPAGTKIAVCISLLQRLETVYPAADEFRPARFRDWRPESYAWAPFGGGTRRCLGSRLAVLEMKTVLRTLVSARRLEQSPRPPEATSSLAMRPARGARITLRPLA